jgi:hypothetical protein
MENGLFEIILLYITHQNDFNFVSEIEMLLRHACVYDVSELIRMLVDAELIRRAVIQAATNMYPLARMLGRDKICAMLEEIIQANEFTSFDHLLQIKGHSQTFRIIHGPSNVFLRSNCHCCLYQTQRCTQQ